MVRLWVSVCVVAMTAWSMTASAQPASPDEPSPPSEEIAPDEVAPEGDDGKSDPVPPGAADEALIDLGGSDAPKTAPEAYPSAEAPPVPAYVPPAEARFAPPIPPAPLTEDDLPRRSIGMMVTGIVLTSLGAVAALTGAAIAGSAEECEDESCRRVEAHRFGVGLGVGGLAVIGAGVPLLVVGAQRVRPEPGPSVSLSVGPAAFRLRSTF